MSNHELLLEEIRDVLKELLRSNQTVIQSNNEIKELLLGRSEYHRNPSTTDVVLSNADHEQNFMKEKSTCVNENADLFKRIINVYFNEEIQRIKSNNVRKSARRVSVELGGTMCDFLNQRLQGTGLNFDRFPDGLILVTAGGEWRGAIKIISDIGFNRGEQWYEYAENIVNHCKTKYDISNDRIYFVIASLQNGLDQGFVEKILNREIRSNREFMTNRDWVNEYIKRFAELTISLAEPRNQIYVMASELHPNVVADDLHKMNDEQRRGVFKQVDEYNWISDINGLLNELRNLI